MPESRPVALLLPDEPLLERLGVMAVCLAFGAWMIYVGRLNVRTEVAEESGKRALFLKLMGSSTSMQGRRAVLTGWVRIVLGAVVIAFGFVFLLFGAFLK
jgi:hypothetical protein